MIVVFGSINTDMIFSINKMPNPGETIISNKYKLRLGGKGANQAIAASYFYSQISFVGCVGGDDFANICLSNLSKYSIDTSLISRVSSSTGCASIFVDNKGENMITVARGANEEIKASQLPESIFDSTPAIICQMEVPWSETKIIIERAYNNQCPVFLNLAPGKNISMDILHKVSTLIMNEWEAKLLLNIDNDSELLKGLKNLALIYNIDCLLTLGSKGACLITPKGSWSLKALDIEVKDTTGAGDAFVGVYVANIQQQMSKVEALRMASVAAGLCCQCEGAQIRNGLLEKIIQHKENSPLPLNIEII